MKEVQNHFTGLPEGEQAAVKKLIIGEKPLVMGVLNVTPDSFSDGGRFDDIDKAVQHALLMASQGADIIDIGGESTRPGANRLEISEELDRVMPVLDRLKGKLNIPISIDTRNSEVARKACEAGAAVINDVSGLDNDEEIAHVAKEYNTFLILMHMRGTPETMQSDIHYDDLIGDISNVLLKAVDKAASCGVSKDRIILDPGIGFGKTVENNFSILKNISLFKKLGFPMIIGASRKSFIGKTFNLPVEERLEGSLAAAMYAILQGVNIVRVHDVLPTVRILRMIEKISEADK